MRMKVLKSVLVGAALAATVALVGCAQTPAPTSVVVSEAGSVITVNSSSEVKVVPDKAQIGVSFTVQASTSESAQAQSTEAVNAVIDALKQAGIPEESIQTTWTSIYPIYGDFYGVQPMFDEPMAEEGVAYSEDIAYEEDEAYETEIMEDSAYAPGAADYNAIVGYEMNTHLSVDGLDIDKVGSIMQLAVSAGATGVDGPQYYSSEYDAAYQQALSQAVDAAQVKAEALAEASGVGLGQIVNVSEGYQDTSYKYMAMDSVYVEEAAAADAGGGMDVAPGQITIRAQVTVSYAIA